MPTPTPTPTTTGQLPFLVPGANKPCWTYYKIFGSLSPSPSSKPPLVLLHGGPGCSHDVMLAYLPLYEEHGIPLVLYDQIGNAGSTHLPEKKGDEAFWSEELFVRELGNLVEGLGLCDREGGWDLLGQSWGGMFGSTFAAGRPKGLRKLILSNSPADQKLWIDGQWKFRRELPQEMQDTMKRHEDEGTTGGAEYQSIMMNEFFKKHACTVWPIPEDLVKTMEWAGKDETVGPTMEGKNDFELGGSLANWSVVEKVKNIEVPTLVINGTNEAATDEAVKPFVDGIKDVKWVKLEHSTHSPMYEEPERYFEVLVGFLEAK